MDTQTLARCARCAARTPAGGGLCGHATCDTPAHARHAVTDVAGTSACGDCAGPLLDLVLHPLQVIYVPVARDVPLPGDWNNVTEGGRNTVEYRGGGNSGP